MPYKDPEKRRKRDKKYYHENIEQCRAYCRKWYSKNKKKAKKNKARWAKNNLIRAKAYNLMYNAKQRAKKKGIIFDLDLNWVEAQLIKGCALSGIPFDFNPGGIMSPYSPSLDRIDINKGYTKINTQAILQGINGLKLTGSNEDVLLIAKAIVTNANYVPE